MSTYRTSRDARASKLEFENSLRTFPESRLHSLKKIKTKKFLIEASGERLNSRIMG